MTSIAGPELWLDWCSVTNTSVDRRDERTLALFTKQAQPSRRVLEALLPHITQQVAPAWPAAYRYDSDALGTLLRRSAASIQNPGTYWVVRLRLRRMRCCAVLIAPTQQGGLGLTRRRACDLTPTGMLRIWSRIGTSTEPDACPLCAVWSWLQVIGINNGWAHSSVRALGYRYDDMASGHKHGLNDLSADWRACPGLLPAIDRWGYVDLYASMHPSSLSVLVRAIQTMLDAPAPQTRPPDPVPNRSRPRYTPEEEAQILARADELNARIAAILSEYN